MAVLEIYGALWPLKITPLVPPLIFIPGSVIICKRGKKSAKFQLYRNQNMFIFRFSIDFSAATENRAHIADELVLTLAYYSLNGQILGREDCYYFDGNRIVGFVRTPEKVSLRRKWDDVLVTLMRRKLETLCGSRLTFDYLGEDRDSAKVCRCAEPSSYVVYTEGLQIGSPLRCGACGDEVPLYRLPRRPECPKAWDYGSIFEWERDFQSCVDLQISCGFAERWAMRQMCDANSGLARNGREVASQIESQTGVPTYYYLYNFRHITLAQDARRPCPSCGDAWIRLPEPVWHFDYRCDACRLVTNVTFNSR